MADPAALRRALQRFPARAANSERYYAPRGTEEPARTADTLVN
jgi:hypothetical protein